MKIALIAPPWVPIPPKLYGGTETVIALLANSFTELGQDVTLFTTGDSTAKVKMKYLLAKAEGDRIGSSVPEARHALFAYSDIRDFDVIHDHSIFGPIIAFERKLDVPVVTTVHGPFNDELTDLYLHIHDRIKIVAISKSQAASANGIKIAKIIHHGINADDFIFEEKPKGYMLFLGRMAYEKGAHRAIEAAKLTKMPLIIAGKKREPWENKYFDELIRPELNSEITYAGEVSHEEKLELLRGALALLFPISWPEPFGMVLLEAMACGTPVISFNQGAAPEIISDKETGFLVGDVKGMAEAIKRIGEIDRKLTRKHVENNFSATKMAKSYLELFKGI